MQSIRLSYYVELILKCILFDGFLTNNVTNTDKILPYIDVNVLIVQGPFAFLEQSHMKFDLTDKRKSYL